MKFPAVCLDQFTLNVCVVTVTLSVKNECVLHNKFSLRFSLNRRHNNSRDLILLPQIKTYAGNPFVSRLESYEETCRDLLSSNQKTFEGLIKKDACDGVMKFLDRHCKANAWK